MRWFAWPPRRGQSPVAESGPTRTGRPESATADPAPADDCAAFLTGNLAEYRIAHNQIVSTWEWTNLLAHGDLGALRSEGTGAEEHRSPLRTSAPADGWQAARSYLASEILDLVERSDSLGELQRSALVPLELELACSPQATRWQPHEWVLTVEPVLSAWRKGARHPMYGEPGLPP